MKDKRCKSIHPSFHLSLIALIFILSNSVFLLSGVNATESNQPYSHINFFTRGQTRYEVNLTLSRGLLLINDTNSYHLSLTPHPFDKYPNVTLDMIEISSIRFDFYKEDRETLTASTDLFYTSTMYNRSKIPVPYGNTTTLVFQIGGNQKPCGSALRWIMASSFIFPQETITRLQFLVIPPNSLAHLRFRGFP